MKNVQRLATVLDQIAEVRKPEFGSVMLGIQLALSDSPFWRRVVSELDDEGVTTAMADTVCAAIRANYEPLEEEVT
jgi:hypothetical protein